MHYKSEAIITVPLYSYILILGFNVFSFLHSDFRI